MSVQTGGYAPYPEFRQHYPATHPAPVIWRWKALSEGLDTAEHTEYGTLTLSMPDGNHEIVPGMGMTFQVVSPGGRTTTHAHSWWHLYFVRSGVGSVVFDKSQDVAQLHVGDIMLIPAWAEHHFENLGTDDDLVLLSMTNLPQQAELANLLVRTDADEEGERAQPR